MSEDPKKYRTKRILQDGVLRYLKVPINPEIELDEAKEEIVRLKNLVDELRNKVEQLEQEKQRQELRDAPMDSADSYQIYK
jgi:DNA-binding Lrp family transcriptional regulator